MTTQNVSQMYNIPDHVDEAFVFTPEQWQALPPDINIDEQLKLWKGKPPMPADTDIQQVRYYIDERIGFSWDNGEITFQIYLPEDYLVQTIVHEINGETVLIQKNGQTLLDRGKYLDPSQIEQKNQVVKQKLGLV